MNLKMSGLVAAMAIFLAVFVGDALAASAWLLVAGTSAVEDDGGLAITLGLSQPVRHRVFALAQPNRLVIDLAGTDLSAMPGDFGMESGLLLGARAGLYRPEWSRIVLDLAEPLAVASVLLQDGKLSIQLQPVSQEEFDQRAGAPVDALWDAPVSEGIPGLRARAMQEGPVVVALDPGHGGIDPGAVRGGVSEKDIVLEFSLVLQEVLEKSGDYAVYMTRDADVFVSLRDRVDMARRANADVFLSVHANTVETGDVSGATIYALSEVASDTAARQLAEFENQSDIFAGADYQGGEDQVALALIDLARLQTDARSHNLGLALLAGLRSSVGVTRNHPFWSADLRVLKAPDMPSLLLELGFLSDDTDRANLQSPEWRERAATGIIAALDTWVAQDRAAAALLRQ